MAAAEAQSPTKGAFPQRERANTPEGLPFFRNAHIEVEEQSLKPNAPFVITKTINGNEHPVGMLAYENNVLYLLCYSPSEEQAMLIALSEKTVDPGQNNIRFNSKVQFIAPSPQFISKRKLKGRNNLDFLLHPDGSKEIPELIKILPEGYESMFTFDGLATSKPLTDTTRNLVIQSIQQVCEKAVPSFETVEGKNKRQYRRRARHDIQRILSMLHKVGSEKSHNLVENNGARVRSFGQGLYIPIPQVSHPIYENTGTALEEEKWLTDAGPRGVDRTSAELSSGEHKQPSQVRRTRAPRKGPHGTDTSEELLQGFQPQYPSLAEMKPLPITEEDEQLVEFFQNINAQFDPKAYDTTVSPDKRSVRLEPKNDGSLPTFSIANFPESKEQPFRAIGPRIRLTIESKGEIIEIHWEKFTYPELYRDGIKQKELKEKVLTDTLTHLLSNLAKTTIDTNLRRRSELQTTLQAFIR